MSLCHLCACVIVIKTKTSINLSCCPLGLYIVGQVLYEDAHKLSKLFKFLLIYE